MSSVVFFDGDVETLFSWATNAMDYRFLSVSLAPATFPVEIFQPIPSNILSKSDYQDMLHWTSFLSYGNGRWPWLKYELLLFLVNPTSTSQGGSVYIH